MFDPQTYAMLRQCAGRAAAARDTTALATGTQVCDALREVQKTVDMLDGIRADLLARLEATDGHNEEGASTSAGWARRELRMGLGESRKSIRAGTTLHTLPDVAAALAAGKIRAAHVYEFTAGITKLDADVMVDLQEILLPVAESCDPPVLREAVSYLHEVLHPDDLDDKYAKGMDRADIKAAKCGQGWHLSGFLPQHVGVKLNEWLKAASAPEGDGDDRAPSQRRIDAFERLLDGAETDPADAPAESQTSTERPGDTPGPQQDSQPRSDSRRRGRADTRLLVLADLEALLRMPGAGPATLAGFGHIGQQLLGYLTCGSDITGILRHGFTSGPVPQANILNVGRTSRLATARQRHAVIARQEGVCAAPGCGLSRLDVHHVAWWHRDGGRSDLSNLVGLCSGCHHLVHQDKLTIEADGHGGFTFRRQTGRRIDDHTRVTKQQVRDIIAQIRYTADTAERTTGEPSTSSTQSTDPPGGEAEQTRRLRSHGIEIRPIRYDDLTTTYPPD